MSESPQLLSLSVAYAEPEHQWVVELSLPAGSTVRDALQAVALRPPFSELSWERMPVGIYGEPATLAQPLSNHDRVELYRPLAMDPKAARRLRAQDAGRS